MLQLEGGYGNGWPHLMSLYGGLKAEHEKRVGFHVHLPPSFQGRSAGGQPRCANREVPLKVWRFLFLGC
jgi:hypothetical protein